MDAKHQPSFRCNEVVQVGSSLFYFYSFFFLRLLVSLLSLLFLFMFCPHLIFLYSLFTVCTFSHI